MAIPETQLVTWSHQGSIAQSAATYRAIKTTLEDTGSPYADKSFEVFLQGSYGNDTNIYAESDVDVVIRLDSCFQHDLDDLPSDQKDAFKSSYGDATYTHKDFKEDVLAVLRAEYGGTVDPGEKAITVLADGSRRSSDIIAAIQFRRYREFLSKSDQDYESGIAFYTRSGTRIANYPKQHSANCTEKHGATNNWFKPVVRMFKNMRSKMVDDGLIADGLVPSYFIEGILYNVPNEHFGVSYGDSVVNCVNWIQSQDRTNFVCANKQHYLLREEAPVTWRAEKCNEFLSAAVRLWNKW